MGRGVRGLFRAARAVDALLDRIRSELVQGFLPQKDELVDFLSLGETVASRVQAFLYEDILSFEQWDSIQQTIEGTALSLAQLEDALVELRRAVTWSSRFSGFNWWLRKRQEEMGVADFLVIAGPGSCRDFNIERISSVARTFEQANISINLGPEQIEKLRKIRILTVPQNDGASARWHPISLGHELAHLRYDTTWIFEWMADQGAEAGSAAGDAIAVAKQGASEQPPTLERWLTHLVAWLVETSCDAAMYRFYGARSVETLATYLSVHSANDDGVDHPSPEVRIAALEAVAPAELGVHKLKPVEGTMFDRQRKNAYCDLAVGVRDAVLAALGSTPEGNERRGYVETQALAALDLDQTPGASGWDLDSVRLHPEDVEAGLVGSLWASDVSDVIGSPPNDQADGLRERRIEHAVDFLQFLHRFEQRRIALAIEQPSPQDVPTNVLFISSEGISKYAEASQPSAGAEGAHGGVAAHDVRLGRHFIVFRRNQIATLNALDAERQSRQIQEAVEIGWGDTFVLHPAEMVLAVTLESMNMAEDCTAQVLSRSSLGRMGLLSATAVQVQPGFRGCLTLELVNLASVPLMLSPGQRIAQIVPTLAVGAPLHYEGKYQDQDWKPRFSAVVSDWEMQILKPPSNETQERGGI